MLTESPSRADHRGERDKRQREAFEKKCSQEQVGRVVAETKVVFSVPVKYLLVKYCEKIIYALRYDDTGRKG